MKKTIFSGDEGPFLRTVALLLVLPVILLCGCGLVSVDELSRERSPDGKVDAVLLEINGGAVTDYAYAVLIVPAGAVKTARERDSVREDAVFRADKAENVKMRWTPAGDLEIGYDEARIHHFTNFWFSRDVDEYKYVVHIRLDEGGEGLP